MCKMAKAVTHYEKASCVHGYTVLRIATKTFWEAAVGETVVCMLEPGNYNAIAVEKDGRIIGHLPQKVSHGHALFLR